MRILQVISSAGFYGAESVVVGLSEALIRLGHDVTLAAIRNEQNPNSEIADRAQSSGIPVEIVPCCGRLDLRALQVLRRIKNKFAPSVVHAHGYKADIYALLMIARHHCAFVSTCHNWTNSSRSLRGYAKLDRIALRQYDRVICVSAAVQEALVTSGVGAKRTAVIWNGVDTQKFAAAPPILEKQPRSILIGMVGRLVREKGFHLVLKAAPAILNQHPEVRFVFVGEGSDRCELEALAHRLGISEKVLFLGACADMPGVYRTLDLMVHPSFNEGMPMVLLEAMSAGVPVIATSVGSIPKIIKDGCTGLLIPPGDSLAVRDAILRCLSQPAARKSIGQAGQAWSFENASIQRTAEGYLEHYECILKRQLDHREGIPGYDR